MTSPNVDLFHGKVPSPEEFFTDGHVSKELELINFNNMLDAVSSIPLYERLDLRRDVFSSEELHLLDSEAKDYSMKYKDDLKKQSQNISPHNSTDSIKEPFPFIKCECVNKYSCSCCEDIDNIGEAELFLNHLYDSIDDDSFLSTLMSNIDYGIFSKLPEEQVTNQTKPADLNKFLYDIGAGNYDNFTQPALKVDSSSSSDSEEEISLKARELSSTYSFPAESSRFSFLKQIAEDSEKLILQGYVNSEKPDLKSQSNWISSDDESDIQLPDRGGNREKKKYSKVLDNSQNNPKFTKSRSKIKNNQGTKHNVNPLIDNKTNLEISPLTENKNKNQSPQSVMTEGEKQSSFKNNANESKNPSSSSKSGMTANKHHNPSKSILNESKKHSSSKSSPNKNKNQNSSKSSVNKNQNQGSSTSGVHENIRKIKDDESSLKGGVSDAVNIKQTLGNEKSKVNSKTAESTKVKKSLAMSDSGSSDEDWSQLADRNLSLVENILQKKKNNKHQ